MSSSLIIKSRAQFIEHLFCVKYYARCSRHKLEKTQSLIGWDFSVTRVKQTHLLTNIWMEDDTCKSRKAVEMREVFGQQLNQLLTDSGGFEGEVPLKGAY